MIVSGGGSGWERAVRELRADPARRALVLDGYYDDPLTEAAARYYASEEWQAIRPLLPATPSRVLDVGAGRGIASYALARDGHAVTALEPDPGPVVGAAAIRELARATATRIEVCEGQSESMPFAAHCFDVVFARAVLHHARDLHAFCREAFRVLRRGGTLVAVREHVISHPQDLPAFLADHPLHRYYGGEHAYSLDQYRRAIEQAGFRLDRVLAPLTSAINYAPYTQDRLQRELARRASRGVPALEAFALALLRLPGSWAVASRTLQWFDTRPGRLYSFKAIHP